MNSVFDNPFPYSDDNKRYQTYSWYLKKRFGKKVYKVPLNIDLGCPNRDGTKGTGGCKFCSAKMSGDFAGDPADDILTQYAEIKEKMSHKWADGLCIPYFQAGSNTYCDVSTLEKMLSAAMGFDNAVGISVATRADCLDEEKCALLGRFAQKTYLTVELGLQTIHDETALAMNRCHTYADFLKGYKMLRENGVNVCVHIINGLPNEDREMMLETVRELSRLDMHSIKIHLLHVLKNTELAAMYERGEFKAMEMEDYVQLVCDQIELLSPETVVQRVTGDGARDELIAPMWSLKKFCVMNEIDKELGRRNSWQGKYYKHYAEDKG